MSNGIQMDEWSGAGATKKLDATMTDFAENTERAARTMIRLTWAIVFLTTVMFGAVVTQILIARGVI